MKALELFQAIADYRSVISTCSFQVVAILQSHSKPNEFIFLNLNYTLFEYIMWGFLGLQYVWFLCVFLINRLAEPVYPCDAHDDTSHIRNLFHYLLMWPTITAYCIIEVFAFLEVTVRGKAVCSHSASKKDALVKKVLSADSVIRI